MTLISKENCYLISFSFWCISSSIFFKSSHYVTYCYTFRIKWPIIYTRTPISRICKFLVKNRHYQLKVAEHSFRARFCWCNSARAQVLQKTNMPSMERSFYILNTRSMCAIFVYNWTQRIDGFSLLLQRYVR